MPRRPAAYPPAFREQIIALARAGRSAKELAQEFEPSEQTIPNWIFQAEADRGERPAALTTDERAELTRLQPAEILLADGMQERLPPGFAASVSALPAWHFDADSARRRLCRQFGTQDLAGFGAQDLGPAVGAAGALLESAARRKAGRSRRCWG